MVLGGGAVSYERGTPVPSIQRKPAVANSGTTQWTTSHSSKVNLPYTINFRALRGANLVTLRSISDPFKVSRNPRIPPCGAQKCESVRSTCGNELTFHSSYIHTPSYVRSHFTLTPAGAICREKLTAVKSQLFASGGARNLRSAEESRPSRVPPGMPFD